MSELARFGLAAGAALAAGAVNAIAGGGSLITFPALVATGLPAVEVDGAGGRRRSPFRVVLAACQPDSRNDDRDHPPMRHGAKHTRVAGRSVIRRIEPCASRNV
jgi:hypothetical protein